MKLAGFQKRFLAQALAADVDTAALSIPRDNGKSWLGAHILTRCLTPGDPLHQPGKEYVLCAASIEQARIVYRFARAEIEGSGEYHFIDSHTRIGITHKSTNTKLRVMSSNAKTAMGLVGTPIVVADEPGSWEVNGGTLMFDAIQTAQGKPGSKLKAIYIGTLAPAESGWWHDPVDDGTHGSTYVQVLRGRIDKDDEFWWTKWPEIARFNPLTRVDAGFRKKLQEERDGGLKDSRLKARFLFYRLNSPTADEANVPPTVADWKLACPLGDVEGFPMVGIDLGGGRAWSAAVAGWRSGRIEAVAVAPGIPSIEEQEVRDRVPRGTYQKLVDAGVLIQDEGRRVPRVEKLISIIKPWGPEAIICDRFRFNELQDETTIPIYPRVSRWSEAAEDLRALRKMAKDGPMSVGMESRALIQASLGQSRVKNDDQGSFRLVKRDPKNNTGRDDVAAALVLVAGAMDRRPAPRRAYLGAA
ncbi:MAG: hypothetical protein OXN89_05060 [Bryobacterales bacterium]|nr:hypothetical protein [Bryobacterales bacterium]